MNIFNLKYMFYETAILPHCLLKCFTQKFIRGYLKGRF